MDEVDVRSVGVVPAIVCKNVTAHFKYLQPAVIALLSLCVCSLCMHSTCNQYKKQNKTRNLNHLSTG